MTQQTLTSSEGEPQIHARAPFVYWNANRPGGTFIAGCLHRRKFLRSKGQNTYPPDLENAASSKSPIAGPVILRRILVVLQLHGRRGEAGDNARPNSICTQLQKDQFAIEAESYIDDDGRDTIRFDVRYNRGLVFSGTAAKVEGQYRIVKAKIWKHNRWQRRLFGAFPVPSDAFRGHHRQRSI